MTRPFDRFAKSAVAACAVAALAVGCSKSEAERFGYKGEDAIDSTNLTYLVLSPTVTNWVPERVLSVVEQYDFTAEELGVLKAAGALMPGESYPEIADGFAKTTEEPWFTVWTKSVESFGLKGVTGVMSHYNEDSKLWETSESYFSSYWQSREEALAALATIETELSTKHGVKMFHRFDGCWVAEYVRLCVMGVVGQKADGQWSCMLDFRDKCRSGCGAWEPVEEQQERLDQYRYAKAMKAWRAEVAELLAKNHEAVLKKAAELGLAGLDDVSEAMQSDGRSIRCLSGRTDPLKAEDDLKSVAETLWQARLEQIEKALGVKIEGEPVNHDEAQEQGIWWSAQVQGELYEVRLDVAVPKVPTPPEESDAEAEVPQVAGQWRIIYAEKLLPGCDLPARPELKK